MGIQVQSQRAVGDFSRRFRNVFTGELANHLRVRFRKPLDRSLALQRLRRPERADEHARRQVRTGERRVRTVGVVQHRLLVLREEFLPDRPDRNERCIKLGGPYAQKAAEALSMLQWGKAGSGGLAPQ